MREEIFVIRTNPLNLELFAEPTLALPFLLSDHQTVLKLAPKRNLKKYLKLLSKGVLLRALTNGKTKFKVGNRVKVYWLWNVKVPFRLKQTKVILKKKQVLKTIGIVIQIVINLNCILTITLIKIAKTFQILKV